MNSICIPIIARVRIHWRCALIFVLTYIAYGLVRSNRKSFANSKPSIIEEWSPPELENGSSFALYPPEHWTGNTVFDKKDSAAFFVGVLNSCFLFTYAVGMYITGWLGDRYDHICILFVGMVGTGVSIFLFAVVTECFKFYNKAFYLIVWIANGFFQSFTWPQALAIISDWFPNNIGFVIGVWATCTFNGNIFGDVLVGSLVSYGYHYPMFVSSTLLVAFAFLLLFGVSRRPTVNENVQGDLAIPEKEVESFPLNAMKLNAQNKSAIDKSIVSLDEEKIADVVEVLGNSKRSGADVYVKVCLTPEVMLCSFAYICIKLVDYALFFWLTYYLTNNFQWSNSYASHYTTYYDIGGILGGVFAGILWDYLPNRFNKNVIPVVLSALSVPALVFYGYLPANPRWLNALLLGLNGLLVGAVSNIVSTIVVPELSKLPRLIKYQTVATVAGVINGFGSFGAAVGQLVIPILSSKKGWMPIFHMFLVCMSVAFLSLLILSLKNVCLRMKRRWERHH